MKVTQSWTRNMRDTLVGESITLTTVYSSFDPEEIDRLEENMPKGILVMDGSHNRMEEEE